MKQFLLGLVFIGILGATIHAFGEQSTIYPYTSPLQSNKNITGKNNINSVRDDANTDIQAMRSAQQTMNTDAYTHSANTSNPHSVTKTQVGLGSVDNTSDANKPVSTATQTALDNKQNRVTGTCGAGLAVQSVTSDGAVTCGTAGSGTSLTGTEGQIVQFDSNNTPVAVTAAPLAFTSNVSRDSSTGVVSVPVTSTASSGSTTPITSGGVYTAIQNLNGGSFSFDEFPSYDDSAHTSGIAVNGTTLTVYSPTAGKWLTVGLTDTLDSTPVSASISDDFSSDTTANYTQVTSYGMTISGGYGYGGTQYEKTIMVHETSISTSNQTVTGSIETSSGSNSMLVFRASSASNSATGYMVGISSVSAPGYAKLYAFNGSTITDLDKIWELTSTPSGSVLYPTKIVSNGTSFELFMDFGSGYVSQGTKTDSTYASGTYCGMAWDRSVGGNPRGDNLTCN